MDTKNPETAQIIDSHIESEDWIECPNCGALCFHSWSDECFRERIESAGITFSHIGTAGGWEWHCDNCDTHWMEEDSPLNHPAYTHADD